MGICASCLGVRKRSGSPTPSDIDALLSGDQFHYGTLASADQPDPEAIQRERDALERLCEITNSQLIDVNHTHYAHYFDPKDQRFDPLQHPEVQARFNEVFANAGESPAVSPSPKFDNIEMSEQQWLNRILESKGIKADDPSPWDVVHRVDGNIVTSFYDDDGPNGVDSTSQSKNTSRVSTGL